MLFTKIRTRFVGGRSETHPWINRTVEKALGCETLKPKEGILSIL